jgi:hypothetical protein
MNTTFIKATTISGSATASCGGNQYDPNTNCPRAEGVLRIGAASGSIDLIGGGTINLGWIQQNTIFYCKPSLVTMTSGTASVLEV